MVPFFFFFFNLVHGGTSGKEPVCQSWRCWVGRIPWVEKVPGYGNPFQENPMDRGAWWAVAHGVTKSQT